jgi:hypothetical protein
MRGLCMLFDIISIDKSVNDQWLLRPLHFVANWFLVLPEFRIFVIDFQIEQLNPFPDSFRDNLQRKLLIHLFALDQ